MISIELKQTLVQGLELTGGITSQTVFPKTEEMLHQLEYQRSLEFVARKKNMDKYHSMMDFLFTESWPEKWKIKVFRYYNGNGCTLIDDPDVTDLELKAYDTIMSELILPLCHEMLKEKRVKGWAEVRRIIHHIMVAA